MSYLSMLQDEEMFWAVATHAAEITAAIAIADFTHMSSVGAGGFAHMSDPPLTASVSAAGFEDALRLALRSEFMRPEYGVELGDWMLAGEADDKLDLAGLAAATDRVMKDTSAAMHVENFLFHALCEQRATGALRAPSLASVALTSSVDSLAAVQSERRSWSCALFSKLEDIIKKSGLPVACSRATDRKKETYSDKPIGAIGKEALFSEEELLAALCRVTDKSTGSRSTVSSVSGGAAAAVPRMISAGTACRFACPLSSAPWRFPRMLCACHVYVLCCCSVWHPV